MTGIEETIWNEAATKPEYQFDATAEKMGLLHALSWEGEGIARALHRRAIYWQALSALDNDRAPEDIAADLVKMAEEEMLRAAKWPSRSTNPMANLLEGAKAQAWADVYETMKRYTT